MRGVTCAPLVVYSDASYTKGPDRAHLGFVLFNCGPGSAVKAGTMALHEATMSLSCLGSSYPYAAKASPGLSSPGST